LSSELIFETHAITIDNERGIATGWRDGELSDAGKRLAAELGARHRARPPDAVYTSDLGRAVETAEIAFAASGIPIRRDARLRECDYGELTGMTVERLDAERAGHVEVPFPGGESYREVAGRVGEFLHDVRAEHADERLVVIGHSATRWALDELIGGVRLELSVIAPFAWQSGWTYMLR
jgi:broad specificity phosphatase PhoE